MTFTDGSGQPQLVVTPELPSLDSELHIRLHDLQPGTEVTLSARLTDPRGRQWRSSATFRAAADGTVDLGRDAPNHGSYQAADPMGLVWSMERLPEPAPGRPADFLAPTPLRLVAQIAGEQVASANLERLRVPAGLRRTDVRQDGLVGTLYCPERAEPLPGVLLLGGSEGGMHEDEAALLAAHGFAVLALAYYGLPGLPATLAGIPLEYFGTALDYLQEHPQVRSNRLAVVGGSKGGEAALLVGAMFPQVRAVVSVVGSGVVTQGISQDVLTGSLLEILSTPVAGWTYQGQDVPYLPNVVTPELAAAVAAGEPVALRLAFEPGLRRADLLPAATIPVERIRGAVLLISTDDDQMGHCAALHEVAARRLAAHDHPHPWQHIVYEGAGHFIAGPPYRATTQSLTPGPGVTFCGGGTPASDARAQAGAWHEMLLFLATQIAA